MHGFTATRTAMLKNIKTGRGIPLYMVNVLPKKDFDCIYKIQELCYIRVSIEDFRNVNNPKQCYRCQRFGSETEICNFKPKYMRCAEEHLTLNYQYKGRMIYTFHNCGAAHPSSSRGCPKDPLNQNRTPLTIKLLISKPPRKPNDRLT